MPWREKKRIGDRDRAEEDPTIRDVWTNIRVILNHAGGMFNLLSSITLQLARIDARLEHLESMATPPVLVDDGDPEQAQLPFGDGPGVLRYTREPA